MQDDPLAAALSSGRLTRGEMRLSYNRQVLLLCTQPLNGQLVCNLVISLTVTGRITNNQRPTHQSSLSLFDIFIKLSDIVSNDPDGLIVEADQGCWSNTTRCICSLSVSTIIYSVLLRTERRNNSDNSQETRCQNRHKMRVSECYSDFSILVFHNVTSIGLKRTRLMVPFFPIRCVTT